MWIIIIFQLLIIARQNRMHYTPIIANSIHHFP